jgi:hypothetical protein
VIVLTGEHHGSSAQGLKYRTMWISLIVCMALTIIAAIGLQTMLSRENVQRDGLSCCQDGPAAAAVTPTVTGLGGDKKGDDEVNRAID